MVVYSHSTKGDPKLWPMWIKCTTLANLCFFVFLGNMYSSGIATGFEELAMDFKVPITKLTDLIAWSVLALGLASVIWMPIALCVGKRPVILLTLLIFTTGSIWSFKATSFNSLLGARVFASIGAGSVETLGPAMLADMYFEKHYATAIAFLQLFLAMGSQIGPLIAGYLIQARGWQWFFKLCAILCGINLFFAAIFLPESTWRRPIAKGENAAEVDQAVVEAKIGSGEATKTIEDVQEVFHAEHTEANAPYAGSYVKDLFAFRNRGLEEQGLRKFPRRFVEPFQFLMVPQVVYAGVSFGLIIAGIVVISSVNPVLLSPPPYLFGSVQLGLFTLSSLVGAVIAYPIAGPLTDLLSRTLRRRTGGIHKPEHRYPALILPFIVCPPGLLAYGYTLARGRNFYGAAAGFALQSAGLVLVPSVTLSYTIDAYPRRSGEALVLINAIKNCVAFGFTKAISSWLANQGVEKMFVEMAGIQWAILFLALPLYFLSPWLRKSTLRFV